MAKNGTEGLLTRDKSDKKSVEVPLQPETQESLKPKHGPEPQAFLLIHHCASLKGLHPAQVYSTGSLNHRCGTASSPQGQALIHQQGQGQKTATLGLNLADGLPLQLPKAFFPLSGFLFPASSGDVVGIWPGTGQPTTRSEIASSCGRPQALPWPRSPCRNLESAARRKRALPHSSIAEARRSLPCSGSSARLRVTWPST